MATTPAAPVEALAGERDAELLLVGHVGSLDDEAVARPSRLPGWTVGHLVTHLARNADSHVRRTRASIDGAMVDQYPGGADQREREIEAGAGRSAAALHTDLEEASVRLVEVWSDVPSRAWANLTRDASGRERRPVGAARPALAGGRGPPGRPRLREVPPRVARRLRGVLPPRDAGRRRGPAARGTGLPGPGTLDERDELAWLYGRLTRDDLPVLGPWS